MPLRLPVRDARGLELGIMGLAMAALGINGYLAWHHFAGGALAGCGGGDCDEMAATRWAVVFGVVPVALCGLLAWVSLLGCAVARRWGAALVCAGLVVGAALWFGYVQAVVLGKFCKWCMVAHGIGLVTAVLLVLRSREERWPPPLWPSAVAGVAGAGLLATVQCLGPAARTHRVAEVTGVDASPVHERGTGPKVRFGGKIFAADALPHLGPPTARCVLVEYFDFTCSACRTMHGFVEELRSRHPAEICVLVLPVPLERSCNAHLSPAEPDHPGACGIARLALAVWRVRPQAYEEYHRWLMAGRTEAEARAKALECVAADELDRTLADPWLGELLAANVRDWKRVAGGEMKLPKLLFSNTRIIHGLPSGADDFVRVMEKELHL